METIVVALTVLSGAYAGFLWFVRSLSRQKLSFGACLLNWSLLLMTVVLLFAVAQGTKIWWLVGIIFNVFGSCHLFNFLLKKWCRCLGQKDKENYQRLRNKRSFGGHDEEGYFNKEML